MLTILGFIIVLLVFGIQKRKPAGKYAVDPMDRQRRYCQECGQCQITYQCGTEHAWWTLVEPVKKADCNCHKDLS